MHEFGPLLNHWRSARRLSQLDLAGVAEVSARHLSCLETGRARPSVEMVDRLARALELPLAEHNRLRTSAGFAARYAQSPIDGAALAPIWAAVDRLLERHAPYPGFAVDADWRLVRLNAPAARLFAPLGLGEGASLLAFMASEAAPLAIENWPEVATAFAQRLRVESAHRGGAPAFERVAAAVSRSGALAQTTGPVVPIVLRSALGPLAMFATILQFGTPNDVALDALKIELYFPADPQSEQRLLAMLQVEVIGASEKSGVGDQSASLELLGDGQVPRDDDGLPETFDRDALLWRP